MILRMRPRFFHSVVPESERVLELLVQDLDDADRYRLLVLGQVTEIGFHRPGRQIPGLSWAR